MPYITREDGERFIIPSYRDILSSKKKSLLKREILMLSANYGQYITFQKKNVDQFEVAFSNEPGYLLGESVWQCLKRPFDMIYCEAIPNTNDAVLVIVKSGSVYLDGSFPIDSIVDELVIFKTQQNNFAIFIHGDVPISEKPEDGKISFDANQVHSFTVLEEPIFPTLPGIKVFQLQLVDVVLKANNIGTLPLKPIVALVVIGVLIWLGSSYLSSHNERLPTSIISSNTNLYDDYYALVDAPDPGDEIDAVIKKAAQAGTVPGWTAKDMIYTPGRPGNLRVRMVSSAPTMHLLLTWAKSYNYKVDIATDGMFVNIPVYIAPREKSKTITSFQETVASLFDRVSHVTSVSLLQFNAIDTKKAYTTADFTLNINDQSLGSFDLLADLFSKMPMVISKIVLSEKDGLISGSITFKVVGN